MLGRIVENSTKLALALGTRGLVNIQYLIYHGELYVIEVNPRASRTIPYISKVTGVPMVDLASRVMVGEKLAALGFGTGLYRTPPYCAVKVPVFSFEKLADANSYLGPEMKSTGEVLGIGKDMGEALFKGLVSAGFHLPAPGEEIGALISVDEYDYYEALGLARKLHNLGCRLYATGGTAAAIATLGIPVETVADIHDLPATRALLESGRVQLIVYTGALMDATLEDYIALHRQALRLNIACLTSLDTANALADSIASRYTQDNTELVDINHMRSSRRRLRFVKMQGTGNDYLFFDNYSGGITDPESLCVRLCRAHYGVGADGIVLIGPSDAAGRAHAHLQPRRHRRAHGGQLHPLRGEVPLRFPPRDLRGDAHRDRQRRQAAEGVHARRLRDLRRSRHGARRSPHGKRAVHAAVRARRRRAGEHWRNGLHGHLRVDGQPALRGVYRRRGRPRP